MQRGVAFATALQPRGPIGERPAPEALTGRAIYSGSIGKRESGGTGRRAGFRCQWGNPWGFESPLSHQLCAQAQRGSP